MASAKVAVTVDEHLLREVDAWVAAGEYASRSRVVQAALTRLRDERNRRGVLMREPARLDAAAERALAEEALTAEVPWPPY